MTLISTALICIVKSAEAVNDKVVIEPNQNYQKVYNPLSKVNLINKAYFVILVIWNKIVPENIIKVTHYFQNYYPQWYEDTCSIWHFLYAKITENLKKWMQNEVSSNYMAREFFVQLWSDYQDKVRNFQITRISPNGQPQSIEK